MRLQDIITKAKQVGDPYIIQDVTELEGQALCNAPELRFRETAQSLPAGLWRWTLSGDVFKLQRNTAAGRDFSTLTTPIQVNASGFVGLKGAPVSNAAFQSYESTYRQCALRSWGDVSSADDGIALFGGNCYRRANDNTWRYSNTHGSIGATGFVTNAPGWNNSSVIYGGNTSSTKDASFTPTYLMVWDKSGAVYINETANSKMTVGLTINQGANDDEILALKSSDVAHGMTTLTETDTFGRINKVIDTGGLYLDGLRGSGGTALILRGLSTAADTAKSTAAGGVVQMESHIINGTGYGDFTANGNVLAIRTKRSGAFVTIAVIDEDGDLHLDATLTQNAWSHHNDAELLHGLRASLLPERHELRQRFGQFIQSAKPVLERTGVVTYNDHEGGDGSIFISVKGLHMLTIDAVRQLYERMKRYEAVLVELGADPKQLEMEYPL